jgi:hypothetical protein
MVNQFHCEKPELTLQIDSKKAESDPKKLLPVLVEFVDFEFITDNDETAKKIEATNLFKSGMIFRQTESSIRDVNRKLGKRPRVVSGHSGTPVQDEEVKKLRAELAKVEAENARLKTVAA